MVPYLDSYKHELRNGIFVAISTSKNERINNVCDTGLHNFFFSVAMFGKLIAFCTHAASN